MRAGATGVSTGISTGISTGKSNICPASRPSRWCSIKIALARASLEVHRAKVRLRISSAIWDIKVQWQYKKGVHFCVLSIYVKELESRCKVPRGA